jgi:hypothetical protein
LGVNPVKVLPYCLMASTSIVSFTASPSIAEGTFGAIPKSVLLIVAVAEKPQ